MDGNGELPTIVSNVKVVSKSQFFAILAEMRQKAEQPYLITTRIIEERHYNPKFGDNRICDCDSFKEINPNLCDVMMLDNKNQTK